MSNQDQIILTPVKANTTQENSIVAGNTLTVFVPKAISSNPAEYGSVSYNDLKEFITDCTYDKDTIETKLDEHVAEAEAYTDTEISNTVGKKQYTINGVGEIFNDYEENSATGDRSHAEGYGTSATAFASHAEGDSTTASGARGSHSEGYRTTASGLFSHAEGQATIASGNISHAEGDGTTASGIASHSGGYSSVASNFASFVHGTGLKTSNNNQAVFGYFNDDDSSALLIVGNGTADSNRNNAFVVKSNGTLYGGGKEISTKQYVNSVGNTKQDKITATNKVNADYIDDSTSTNKFLTASQKEQITTNANNISDIQALIPEETSVLNQLADKNFVNSSIATSTATFRGNYNLVSDLSLTISATHTEIGTALDGVIATADENDYCYVQIPTANDTPTKIERVDRYKYSGGWAYEYPLNNSGFTAGQWEAINSGITSTDVSQIGTNASNISNIQTELAQKITDVQVDDVSIVSGTVANLPTIELTPLAVDASVDPNSNNLITSGAVYASLSTKQDTLSSGINIKTINSTSLLDSGDIEIKGLFYCTYGVTTYAEIETALSNGLLPICKTPADAEGTVEFYIFCKNYRYNHPNYTPAFYFSKLENGVIKTFYIEDDGDDYWSSITSITVENKNNKVTSLSNTSTDSQYPSAKCVYDLIGDVETLLASI